MFYNLYIFLQKKNRKLRYEERMIIEKEKNNRRIFIANP